MHAGLLPVKHKAFMPNEHLRSLPNGLDMTSFKGSSLALDHGLEQALRSTSQMYIAQLDRYTSALNGCSGSAHRITVAQKVMFKTSLTEVEVEASRLTRL